MQLQWSYQSNLWSLRKLYHNISYVFSANVEYNIQSTVLLLFHIAFRCNIAGLSGVIARFKTSFREVIKKEPNVISFIIVMKWLKQWYSLLYSYNLDFLHFHPCGWKLSVHHLCEKSKTCTPSCTNLRFVLTTFLAGSGKHTCSARPSLLNLSLSLPRCLLLVFDADAITGWLLISRHAWMLQPHIKGTLCCSAYY